MKFLFDLFPVILFFIAFKLGGSYAAPGEAIYVATTVAIVATFLQIGWSWFRHRKVDTMLWMSLVIITVFGGMTLIFHDETFIKWKPTVLYWSFAGALAGSAVLLAAIWTLTGAWLHPPGAAHDHAHMHMTSPAR